DLVSIVFFQAEDGIRDFHVTGVQTCALPILVVKIVPPEELPYSDENAPPKTSICSRLFKSIFEVCPCPSGMVAGIPSTYKRTPRTPKLERAPKPRIEICKSWA